METYPFSIPSGVNIIPDISGINNIGSSTLPLNYIYSDNISLLNYIIPSTPPTTKDSDGVPGQIIMGTDGYFYGCSGTNLWGRILLETWQ